MAMLNNQMVYIYIIIIVIIIIVIIIMTLWVKSTVQPWREARFEWFHSSSLSRN